MIRRLVLAASLFFLVGAACPKPHPPTPPPPPPPTSFLLQLYVHDAATDTPLLSASIYRDNLNPHVWVPVGPDAGAAWVLPPSDFNICGQAPGYLDNCIGVPLHSNLTLTLKLTVKPVPPPPPMWQWPPALPRSALDPFPGLTPTQPSNAAVWSAETYDATLPFTPPDHPDIDYHRGNVIGVRVPGLTWHGYGTDKDPTLVTTWDQPRRSVEEQNLVLAQYSHVNGYTHFVLSIPQARNAGVLDQRFLDAAVLAHSDTYKQFVVVAAFGGDGESWEADVLPWLDKLVALRAVDEIITCWQCDQHYDPWALVTLTVQVGEYAHAHGLKVSQHWVNGADAWWNPADDPRRPNTCLDFTTNGVPTPICGRIDYHRVMAKWVDYQYFQGDTEAPISDFQWALAKVLQSFTTEKLVVAEDDMQAEFDNPMIRLEKGGDAKGFLLSCARGFGRVMDGGYMNGSRLPNGHVQ